MKRVSALTPPERPFEVTYADAQGRSASFQIDSRFLADVVRHASLAPAGPIKEPKSECGFVWLFRPNALRTAFPANVWHNARGLRASATTPLRITERRRTLGHGRNVPTFVRNVRNGMETRWGKRCRKPRCLDIYNRRVTAVLHSWSKPRRDLLRAEAHGSIAICPDFMKIKSARRGAFASATDGFQQAQKR
jgi:hypothetical protein